MCGHALKRAFARVYRNVQCDLPGSPITPNKLQQMVVDLEHRELALLAHRADYAGRPRGSGREASSCAKLHQYFLVALGGERNHEDYTVAGVGSRERGEGERQHE